MIKKSLLSTIFIAIIIFPTTFITKANTHTTNIVISFDGMRHDFTENYMNDGTLPHFQSVKDHGISANHFTTIFPSLTATSHAAISTGALPEKTGMVSNHLHQPGQLLTTKNSSFFSSLDVVPIWAEAHKQGKTTATVLFPGSNPEEGNNATYSIYYGKTWAESSLDPLKFTKAISRRNEHSLKQATLAMNLENGQTKKLNIFATNLADSNDRHYYFSFDKSIDHAARIKQNEWGSISFNIEGHLAGFWFKIKETNSGLKLYRTAITSAAIDGPVGFEKSIAATFDFLPVQDDDQALSKKWITRKEYEEISERFAKWTTDVSRFIKDQYQPDLLMLYYPQIDHEEHKYLMMDPRQQGFSDKKAEQYMGYIQWSYELADRSLGKIKNIMNETDRIFLVSDHGMEPVHTKISPNHELEKAGLLKKGRDGNIDTSKSKAYAVASGAIAHIYVNLEGREKGGIVPKKEYFNLEDEILDIFKHLDVELDHIPKIRTARYLFQNWRDDLSDGKKTFSGMYKIFTGINDKPFDYILTQEDMQKRGMNHVYSGDILLVTSEGYYMAQEEDSTADHPDELGNHGGNPNRKALQPIFFAAGDGIDKGIISDDISTIDIAPTLYELMDLVPPSFIDGKPIINIEK